jgi:glutathione S-transferase
MFMAERGLSGIPAETIDIREGKYRREPFNLNYPPGECPALVLDNGTVLAEITAIREYLDEIGPAGTTLICNTPYERAETRMWTRHVV